MKKNLETIECFEQVEPAELSQDLNVVEFVIDETIEGLMHRC